MEMSHPDGLSVLEASHFGPMEQNGGYPRGLLDWLYPLMGVEDPDSVVHLCSGSIKRGVTVDIRPEMEPRIVSDCRDTKITANTVRWVVADPPPMPIYNEIIYGIPSKFPKSEEILTEAHRILVPGGKVAILCFAQPDAGPGYRLIGIYALLLGELVIRGLFLYEKDETALDSAHAT